MINVNGKDSVLSNQLVTNCNGSRLPPSLAVSGGGVALIRAAERQLLLASFGRLSMVRMLATKSWTFVEKPSRPRWTVDRCGYRSALHPKNMTADSRLTPGKVLRKGVAVWLQVPACWFTHRFRSSVVLLAWVAAVFLFAFSFADRS